MITIEKEGKTAEAAISAALTEMNLAIEDTEIEILRKESLFKNALVRVTKKESKADRALEFISKLLLLMKIDSKAEILNTPEGEIINITGKDNGIVIGYRGEVLDALQYLTVVSQNKKEEDYYKIVIDAENYRLKRKNTLENLAERLADKAIRSGRSVEVEPMNPYERKVFHSALTNNSRVKTESEGVDPNRYIVITPLERLDRRDDFSKRGLGKMKSFGAKKKYF